MKTSKTKKLLFLLMAILMVVFSTACNNAAQPEQTTATMAPEIQETSGDLQTGDTAQPTATPDPLAALRYWEIDPDKTIYNILLLGLDELEGTTWARNDTTMILQIDLENNQMKLVSFMRDMWVTIPGQGEYRLNNAHYRGGPELAIQTMKSVFDVDIDYYAVVNFVTFEQLMRLIGTITIDVKDYEVEHLKIARSAVSVEGEMIGGQGVVTSEGEHEFNEYLALSYARDRHSSGDGNERAGDYGRNERQRIVIKAAWEKVKSKSLSLIPASVFLAMPYAETDMNEALIITLIKSMMENNASIEDMAIPVEGKFWSAWINKNRTVEYSNDELEALYLQQKETFLAEQEAEAVEAETQTETEPETFPSYETWRANKEFSNVIQWSNKNISLLHEFLGID